VNGEGLAEPSQCFQADPEPALGAWVVALRGDERQGHRDDVMEENAI
jgi:hypothetical protein